MEWQGKVYIIVNENNNKLSRKVLIFGDDIFLVSQVDFWFFFFFFLRSKQLDIDCITDILNGRNTYTSHLTCPNAHISDSVMELTIQI